MDFVIGFAGAFLCLLLLCTGVVVGWKLKTADYERSVRVTAEKVGETERKRMQEEQEAFELLQNYSVERAYGMADAVKESDSR